MMVVSSTTARTTLDARRGFTLVELLVTLAIMFVLITVVFVSLKSVRRSASRTESLNELRQIMGAYSSYSGDHNGALMPGYIDPNDFDAGQPFAGLKVRLMDSKHELSPSPPGTLSDKSSYVWRLAPYLDNAWKTCMADYRSPGVVERFAIEYGKGDDDGVYGPDSAAANPPTGIPHLGISLRPSFGLNSIYLGGDSEHGDTNAHPAPWSAGSTAANRIAARRQSEVKSPGRIIVFAATRVAESGRLMREPGANLNINVHLGYPVVTAPYASFNPETQLPANQQWQFTSTNQIALLAGSESTTGLPVDRGGELVTDADAPYAVRFFGNHKVPLSRLDGSVGTETLESLGFFRGAGGADPDTYRRRMMRHWSPFAVGSD